MAMDFSFVCFLSTSIHIRLHIISFLCINYKKNYDKLPIQKIIKFILHLTQKKRFSQGSKAQSSSLSKGSVTVCLDTGIKQQPFKSIEFYFDFSSFLFFLPNSNI